MVLVWPAGACAVRSGGHNPPTRKLEVAFKVAGGARAGSKDGCYPPARRMPQLIHHWSQLETDLVAGFGAVERPDVVNVIKRGSSCDRMLFALRHEGRLFVLDTSRGDVEVHGQGAAESEESRRGGRGPLRALSLVSRTSGLSKADRARRLVVRCPKGRFPLGGGITSDPPVGADGEGVYPHSFERLGVQRGYHVTALIIDPSPGDTTPRRATIQAVCGRGLVPHSSPHRTVFVRRGESNTAVASCPPGQYLFSGGFQRTNFTTPFLTWGGNYITESRAISPTAWQVSATATGWDGGELTAIAHCVRDDGPLITEVQASTPIAGGESATATTPGCPEEGLELTAGGFSFNGSRNGFFAGGWFNPDGTWSVNGYAYFGPVPEPGLTAYGYCLDAVG